MTRPSQSPVETVTALPRDTGPALLYAGALRHLAGRVAVLLSTTALRLGRWATRPTREPEPPPREAPGVQPVIAAAVTAAQARHPSAWPRTTPGGITRPRLSVVPDHGAPEGDPTP